MAWQIRGSYYSPCSCEVGCPCTLGEMEGDQGWCSGALAFDIQSGNVDGTNVGGTTVVLVGDWPSGFLAGNGRGRLYFDPGISPQQRTVLEAVLSGRRGGVFETIAALVPEMLPSKEASIRFEKTADATRIKVGNFGELAVTPLRGPTGEHTRLLHAAAAFRDDIILAKGTGSRWRDTDLRQWESGGHAEQADFDWSG